MTAADGRVKLSHPWGVKVKLAVIILHYSQKDLTRKCLESVGQLTPGDFRLTTYLVNNNPQENLQDLKGKFNKTNESNKSYRFNFLETGENRGFAGGNNFGIKAALKEGADYILLVNNDTVLHKNLAVALIQAAKVNPQAGIFGPKIYFYPGKEFHKERYQEKERGRVIWYAGGVIDWQNIYAFHRGVDEVDRGQYDQIGETDFVTGCAMLVKKDVFGKIGFFDERYFLYLEDLELCQRAKKAGFGVCYVPKAKIYHLNAASSTVGGDLHDYFFTRNRLLFGITWASWRTRLALFRESLRMLLTGRKWQKIGVRDFYLRKFGVGSCEDGGKLK